MGSVSPVTNMHHVICLPGAAQSHIKTMLKLAKLLYHKGFHVTFVNTEFNHRRFLNSGGPHSLDGLNHFRFETIPDGLPYSDADATQDLVPLIESLEKNSFAPFCDLIVRLNNDVDIPPVTCIVSDIVMPFSFPASELFGIPVVAFVTVSACSFLAMKHFPDLIDKALIPLKDESFLTNGYLDTVLDWVPGMKDIRLRDFPSFIRTTDENDFWLKYCINIGETSFKASAIVVHTYDALEKDVLNALSLISPPLYVIGPLELLVKQIPNDPLASLNYSLWKEDTECLKWLDSKETESVVYVNFGSITVVSAQQLMEFAWGLANSKHPFLWIIRPDLVMGDSAILPAEFVEETKERGLITSWCPQEEVLNHPSVGVFLTHCGWGSTIESLSAGKPMICWPFFGDQQTNCRFTCQEWEVGMEIDNYVKRDGVEKLVREMMEEEEGDKMKKKAIEWKRLAEEAVTTTGPSSLNLDHLINKVLKY